MLRRAGYSLEIPRHSLLVCCSVLRLCRSMASTRYEFYVYEREAVTRDIFDVRWRTIDGRLHPNEMELKKSLQRVSGTDSSISSLSGPYVLTWDVTDIPGSMTAFFCPRLLSYFVHIRNRCPFSGREGHCVLGGNRCECRDPTITVVSPFGPSQAEKEARVSRPEILEEEIAAWRLSMGYTNGAPNAPGMFGATSATPSAPPLAVEGAGAGGSEDTSALGQCVLLNAVLQDIRKDPSIHVADLCTVCIERPPDTMFYSCKHACVCRGCLGSLKKIACPLCRKKSNIIYLLDDDEDERA